MKKIISGLLLLVAVQSWAQTFGIKTGLAISTFTAGYSQIEPGGFSSVQKGATPKGGLILGVYADLALTKALFLRPGAELVSKGAIQERTGQNGALNIYSFTTSFTAFDFPLNLVYKTRAAGQQRLLLGAGCVPGIINDGILKRFDFGLNVLAGYEFPVGFSFNMNYNHGLIDVRREDSWYAPLKNRYGGITIGYFF
jgi:hypothetical protein